MRRRPDGRRRFCVARRRNHFRLGAGADRDHVARCGRGCCGPRRRHPQNRPARHRRRTERGATGRANTHDDQGTRTRADPHPFLRPRHRQPVAGGLRTVRQHSPLQSAKASGRRRRQHRRCASRGRARRGGFLRHLRSGDDRRRKRQNHAGAVRHQFADGEGEALHAAAAGRDPRARARRREPGARPRRRSLPAAIRLPALPGSSSATPPRATPIRMSASRRAWCRRTSRCCRRPAPPADWSEHAVVVKKGETVGSILRELGAAPEEIKNVIAALGAAAREGGIKEGTSFAC